MLNLGCGNRFHPAWINVDLAPRDPSVLAADLSRGIPYPDASFDVVYHSHVLEHIRREHAARFLRECWRVLKPSGILRVAVPDLERICRLYVDALERASDGCSSAAHEYDWMMLELFDQTVRERTGGQMSVCLRQNPLPAEEFILQRIGNEGRDLLSAFRAESNTNVGRRSKRWRLSSTALRRALLRFLFGRQAAVAWEIGRFRLEGEVHQWMYDRFSLERLMRACGFDAPRVMSATASQIPNWGDYHLETAPDGAVHKPDSLVMEGRKAASTNAS
jgi:predicted SAM-dependent methyltransferase